MEDFVSVLKEKGFLSTWARLLKRKGAPYTLAALTIEQLNQDDEKIRSAFFDLAGYIDCRPWAEVKAKILPHLTDNEKPAFESERAPKFYLGFRKVVVVSISNYYAKVEPAVKLDIPDAAKEQLAAIEQNLKTFAAEEIARQVKAMYSKLTEFFRREFREDWKGEGWDLGTENWNGEPKKKPMDDEGLDAE